MGGYSPHTETDIRNMLQAMGLGNIEDLFKDIPANVRIHNLDGVPEATSEPEVLDHLRTLSQKNLSTSESLNFLGAGAYNHFVPSAVGTLISRSEFATAYTPYQPEVSQGNLQATYEFQSMICALTDLPVSNASLYDGATALTEGAAIAVRTTGSKKILVSKTVSPFSRQVLQSYASGADWEVEEIPFDPTVGSTDLWILQQKLEGNPACFIFQQPNFFGVLEPTKELGELLSPRQSLLIASVDPISLGILAPPGQYLADIAVGNGQALGNTLNYGGPTFGFFACKKELIRQVPGRMAGRTKDIEGRDGFVLTLQTREQHIRREKATSNICTNEALNALAGAIYMSLMGPKGLERVALLSLARAQDLAAQVTNLPGTQKVFSGSSFKEFVIRLPKSPEEINRRLLEKKIIGGFDLTPFYPELSNAWLLCATELTRPVDIQTFVTELRRILTE